MKYYDFIVLFLWITSLSFVEMNKGFIEGLISGIIIAGYVGWRVYHDIR